MPQLMLSIEQKLLFSPQCRNDIYAIVDVINRVETSVFQSWLLFILVLRQRIKFNLGQRFKKNVNLTFSKTMITIKCVIDKMTIGLQTQDDWMTIYQLMLFIFIILFFDRPCKFYVVDYRKVRVVFTLFVFCLCRVMSNTCCVVFCIAFLRRTLC